MQLAAALAICIALNTAIVYVVANDFETIANGLTGAQAVGIASAVTIVPLIAAWALVG